MSDPTEITSQLMTSSLQQGGNTNLAFDHGELLPVVNCITTPTEIFCVTPNTIPSSGHDVDESQVTVQKPDESQNTGQFIEYPGCDSDGSLSRSHEIAEASKTSKPCRSNITIDISSIPPSGTEGLEGNNRKVENQSMCTLSEIEIPSRLSTPTSLQPDISLNAWLQDQTKSSSELSESTSHNQDVVVCMQTAGPSHSRAMTDDTNQDIHHELDRSYTKPRHPALTKRADSNMSTTSSMMSEGHSCRICWTGEAKEALIQPCKCSGSAANVHVSCLKKWLQVTNQFKCEVCRQEYATAKALKPISKWSWRCSKTRPLSQLEAILILLGIVTPPLLCGIVLCSQKVTEYLPEPKHAWKTATLLTLVIASTLMYMAALIYFCFKLNAVCSQWFQNNHRTVVRLGSVETVIESTPSIVEARESDQPLPMDLELFSIWSIG